MSMQYPFTIIESQVCAALQAIKAWQMPISVGTGMVYIPANFVLL